MIQPFKLNHLISCINSTSMLVIHYSLVYILVFAVFLLYLFPTESYFNKSEITCVISKVAFSACIGFGGTKTEMFKQPHKASPPEITLDFVFEFNLIFQ